MSSNDGYLADTECQHRPQGPYRPWYDPGYTADIDSSVGNGILDDLKIRNMGSPSPYSDYSCPSSTTSSPAHNSIQTSNNSPACTDASTESCTEHHTPGGQLIHNSPARSDSESDASKESSLLLGGEVGDPQDGQRWTGKMDSDGMEVSLTTMRLGTIMTPPTFQHPGPQKRKLHASHNPTTQNRPQPVRDPNQMT
ncbi:Hypp6813 [Branchiostoma lanceolatum]|uniref:Hypp6813 protein n=1 Tax=Branchiostoma lanceolatum TaxID=7740 RepID=A0A8K0E578_BRALA|nr:Hypp6813 [Branchiostoma lanceolatum]